MGSESIRGHRHEATSDELPEWVLAVPHVEEVESIGAQLGLISESTSEKFFKYASSHGWRSQGEPGDDRYQGQEQYSRFRQLVYRAAAEEQISLSKGASMLGLSLGQFRGALRNVFA